MNERIQKLARQSGATDENGSQATTVYCFTEQELKGFAELIVKEVTNIVLHYTDVDEGVAVAKNHFGVEE
jgi:hypothetical protein